MAAQYNDRNAPWTQTHPTCWGSVSSERGFLRCHLSLRPFLSRLSRCLLVTCSNPLTHIPDYRGCGLGITPGGMDGMGGQATEAHLTSKTNSHMHV